MLKIVKIEPEALSNSSYLWDDQNWEVEIPVM